MPTNTDRAGWAEAALWAFIAECGGGIDNPGDAHSAVGDLVADLAHWCDENGVRFAEALGSAMTHYYAETCDPADPEHLGCKRCEGAVEQMMGSIEWPESKR